MENTMEKKGFIISKMAVLTQVLGKKISSRDKDRLYARTAYHIKDNSKMVKNMEQVFSKVQNVLSVDNGLKIDLMVMEKLFVRMDLLTKEGSRMAELKDKVSLHITIFMYIQGGLRIIVLRGKDF